MPKSAESRAKESERRANKRALQTSRASARVSKEAGHQAYTNSEDGVCDIVPVSSSSRPPVVLHSNAVTNIQPPKKKEEEVEDVEEVKQPRKNPFAALAGDSDED